MRINNCPSDLIAYLSLTFHFRSHSHPPLLLMTMPLTMHERQVDSIFSHGIYDVDSTLLFFLVLFILPEKFFDIGAGAKKTIPTKAKVYVNAAIELVFGTDGQADLAWFVVATAHAMSGRFKSYGCTFIGTFGLLYIKNVDAVHACLARPSGLCVTLVFLILNVSILGNDNAIVFVLYGLRWVKSARILAGQHVVVLTAMASGTDISQKDGKPIKKRQNRTRDGKVCGDEAKSK
ncbi:hypothetical protein Tco_0650738 [Tanacetum coccineum]